MISRLIFLVQAVAHRINCSARNEMWPGTWSKDAFLLNLFWMTLNTFYLTCFLIECVCVCCFICTFSMYSKFFRYPAF